ncbi:D-glycero-beta-D-manno-heptose 1,7-bisphosphate 7-phosphatase [Colwellia sp. 1_MG-2023]|uniref:D-glycero-beta-D-manno-heptose 1,7-bisphosphate 7-phosphatase n=1 Tax=Colwellia sp. 1_MG-2023 TaxID=3062649 RepID=UPI0026E33BFC|nr:D-glycero-beta-D-manno-heptose 1,7-bisphosphate 7-phosphatase [Colwellia sp. 1_MG-2023]MDO6446002.1 D-glycero-beta-D-manno-heptose 1,7-bisphosphate 7-phosphatase [Colwellia sp. 1_MG-2023]
MNKALFLDRDGIINVDHGYVYQKEQFEFVDGIFELCLDARDKGYLLIVITNQSGIGRGMYSVEQFNLLTNWMVEQFKEKNVIIDDVYFCPHHPLKGKGEYLIDCQCRKPAPGMILQAAEKHHIDLKQSVFIGDKASDMKAAMAAGIKNRLLISSKYDVECHEASRCLTTITETSLYID